MREVTTTHQVYTFDELPESIQDKVVEKNYDINVTHDWWEFLLDDAAEIGLEITEFDDYKCKGKFTKPEIDVANSIMSDHGEQCNTNRAAYQFMEELKPIIAELDVLTMDYENLSDENRERVETLEEKQEELSHEFLNALLEEYRITLRREAEHLTSRDSIIEAINANGYEFLANGTPF